MRQVLRFMIDVIAMVAIGVSIGAAYGMWCFVDGMTS